MCVIWVLMQTMGKECEMVFLQYRQEVSKVISIRETYVSISKST